MPVSRYPLPQVIAALAQETSPATEGKVLMGRAVVLCGLIGRPALNGKQGESYYYLLLLLLPLLPPHYHYYHYY